MGSPGEPANSLASDAASRYNIICSANGSRAAEAIYATGAANYIIRYPKFRVVD